MQRIPRQKTCKQCKTRFKPTLPLQLVCGPSCAISYERTKATAKRVKAERESLRRRREALKSKSDWIKETQAIVNRYVRLRDAGKPCISCNRNTGAKMNAGHYLSTGAHPELRFETGLDGGISNIFLQCEHCNSYRSGNQVKFRQALVDRYGEQAVVDLETQRPMPQWSVEDIKAIKERYRAKVRELL